MKTDISTSVTSGPINFEDVSDWRRLLREDREDVQDEPKIGQPKRKGHKQIGQSTNPVAPRTRIRCETNSGGINYGKNGVFWDVTPCGSCKSRCFGGTWNHLVFLRSVRRLLVAACVVPSSPILVTLIKEAPVSSETSVLTRATRHNIPEDDILHSHCRENLKSYIALTVWTL
jgi:hypothetical protein